MLTKILYLLGLFVSFSSALPRPSSGDDNASDDGDICSLPPVNPSPFACAAAFPKWTFNSEKGVCEKYLYGGCGATKNLFNDEFECLAKCNRKALLRGPADNTTSPCLLPQSPGNCRAVINAFYFDIETKSCNSFIYTGCKGNENIFATVEDCQQKCSENLVSSPPIITAVTLPAPLVDVPAVAKVEVELSQQELCSLPPLKSGLPFACQAAISSWTFNSKTNKCESYIYGGCGKTANVFPSEDDCQTTCDPQTIEPLPKSKAVYV